MKRVSWTAAGLALLLAALVLPAAQPDRKPSEANLRALKDQIAREQRQAKKDATEKTRLNRALEDAEKSESRAVGDLTALRAQRAERARSRQKLVDERAQRQKEREATESDLARQLRSAYFMGRNEPLKLLLNQRNPAEVGRNLTYYGYLGRHRADQIREISENIARIDELTVQIDADDAELATLESAQKDKVKEREDARRKRGQALVSLERESRDRMTMLAQLKQQQKDMERLLKEARQAAESAPFDPDSPFAQRRGKLSWPVTGRIALNYGGLIAGDLRSEGIEIDADRGENVRAIHEGKVVHADWNRQLGLVIILDHGNGYLSIYANNEQLFKQKGAQVKAGETIATVGDSGGRKRPGMHFEIRRGDKPVDPRGWFRTSAPPTG